MKRVLIAICLFSSIISVLGQSKINIGEKYTLMSEILEEDRSYWIALPKNYNDTIYAPQDYPVVYFLDGDRHFHSLTGIQDFLSEGLYASLPQMIYVGILTTEHRSRDLTPTEVNTPQLKKGFLFKESGGNHQFISFLESELMPFINKNYRSNGYNTFIGHSFGGLAVLNTLFTKPELFNAYLAIDPSVWWDKNYILNKAKKQLKTLNLTGKRLFLAQANNELQDNANQQNISDGISLFKEILEEGEVNGLKFKYAFFPEDDHGTVALPAEYSGLKYIFEGYQLPVKSLAINLEKFKTHYNNFTEEIGFYFKPDEARIDGIASYCMKSSNLKNGLYFLQLNVKHYPESAHAHLRLGEMYKRISESDLALQSLKKALELSPNSNLIKESIQSLKE